MPDVSGRIAFRSARVSLVSGLMAQDFNAALRFAPSELSLDDVSGKLAGGSLAGALTLRRRADGLNVQGRLALSGVDASSALSGDGNAIAGRLGLQIEMEGTGMSPRALIGSLTGSGTVTLENAQLAKLDPRAFATTMRAVDQGLPLDAAKIRDTVAFALDAGRLNVKQAEGVVTMTGGQVRLGTVITRAEGAELAVSGNLDLADETIDAKMTLTATNTVALAGRPEVTIALKGPAAAPRRTLDVAALAGWLALRAVEQQAKRLEAIEAERSGRATTQSVPAVVGPPIIAIPAPRPASAPKGAEASAAAPGHAAPLPAPMEIKPAPKPKAIPPTARDQFMNQIGSQR
jgi:large subunit ribosomal protein L24